MELIAFSNLPWDSCFPPEAAPPLGLEARTHVASILTVDPWLGPPLREQLEGESVGGSPTNVALTAAGLGLDTAVVGPVAGDVWGARVRRALEARGVPILELSPPPERQAQSLAFRETGGERRFLATIPELAAHTELPPIPWGTSGWVVASSYEFRSPVFGTLVRRAFREARAAGRRRAFDLAGPHAVRSGAAGIRALVGDGLELLLGGSDAFGALLGELEGEIPAARLRELAPIVVETRGPAGVRLVTVLGEERRPAPAGPVVDTTGAGDALLGGLIAALSAGSSPDAALDAGLVAAAACLRHSGAHIPAASFPALREAIRRGGGSV